MPPGGIPSPDGYGGAYGPYSCACCPPYIRELPMARPWPLDEYLCDGCDQQLPVTVDPDWTVRGLDLEDTVVHFDTKSGQTRVKHSNRVCIYAPRFAAVRKVTGVALHERHLRSAGVTHEEGLVSQEERLPTTTVVQPVEPLKEGGVKIAEIFKERTQGLPMDNTVALRAFHHRFLPYEDFTMIRLGQFELKEKARLAESLDAAMVWMTRLGVQVTINGQQAVAQKGRVRSGALVEYGPLGKPKMRICKVASCKAAKPGEVIDFTLRFDNIGSQTVGNVTIIDNLTTRLEYVPDSQQCSLKNDFFTQENEGESLVLRWEIRDPLPPGKGGLIRFRCRVR